MAEEILVNVTPREVRIATLESGILQDIHIERNLQQGIIGNIYKGKVNRLLPGIQAAFIDIGLDRAAFLHVKDMVNQPQSQNVDIRDFLHPGQELLVQVYKDPLGTKGARLTTQFAIAARYVVLTPHVKQIVFSQKIIDEVERERLQAMILSTEAGGYIFRTAAMGATQAQIDKDVHFLKGLWAEVISRAKQAKVGDVVYTELPLVLRVLRDLDGATVEKIRIDDALIANQMREFAERCIPQLSKRIEYYAESRPIFDINAVEDDVQKALQRKISLKSGGHLIFDQTEAMTTIDVNTGSYLGKGKNQLSNEQIVFNTNLEAVEIIARQVRLRNLGGIIIIDFIDMLNSQNKARLLQKLANELAKDRVRTEISELSSLGLVQMTRKRTRESLEHILCVSCPLCHQRGSLKSLQTICYDIFRELRLSAFHFPTWPGFAVLASENVINYLLAEESTMLTATEAQLGKPIQLRVMASFVQEHYEILPTEKDRE